ncbi:hypothetical protein AYI68_g433 [Smittium mucronatum]|uniref:Uncharacterized protein n=1 Tax=Smittium mucronatum TaxID=133383 RepID=A0A1R0H8G3_9FUNG|nr:hypothetical protein AYI68_g433 [Smittium mucronatum]
MKKGPEDDNRPQDPRSPTLTRPVNPTYDRGSSISDIAKSNIDSKSLTYNRNVRNAKHSTLIDPEPLIKSLQESRQSISGDGRGPPSRRFGPRKSNFSTGLSEKKPLKLSPEDEFSTYFPKIAPTTTASNSNSNSGFDPAPEENDPLSLSEMFASKTPPTLESLAKGFKESSQNSHLASPSPIVNLHRASLDGFSSWENGLLSNSDKASIKSGDSFNVRFSSNPKLHSLPKSESSPNSFKIKPQTQPLKDVKPDSYAGEITTFSRNRNSFGFSRNIQDSPIGSKSLNSSSLKRSDFITSTSFHPQPISPANSDFHNDRSPLTPIFESKSQKRVSIDDTKEIVFSNPTPELETNIETFENDSVDVDFSNKEYESDSYVQDSKDYSVVSLEYPTEIASTEAPDQDVDKSDYHFDYTPEFQSGGMSPRVRPISDSLEPNSVLSNPISYEINISTESLAIPKPKEPVHEKSLSSIEIKATDSTATNLQDLYSDTPLILSRSPSAKSSQVNLKNNVPPTLEAPEVPEDPDSISPIDPDVLIDHLLQNAIDLRTITRDCVTEIQDHNSSLGNKIRHFKESNSKRLIRRGSLPEFLLEVNQKNSSVDKGYQFSDRFVLDFPNNKDPQQIETSETEDVELKNLHIDSLTFEQKLSELKIQLTDVGLKLKIEIEREILAQSNLNADSVDMLEKELVDKNDLVGGFHALIPKIRNFSISINSLISDYVSQNVDTTVRLDTSDLEFAQFNLDEVFKNTSAFLGLASLGETQVLDVQSLVKNLDSAISLLSKFCVEGFKQVIEENKLLRIDAAKALAEVQDSLTMSEEIARLNNALEIAREDIINSTEKDMMVSDHKDLEYQNKVKEMEGEILHLKKFIADILPYSETEQTQAVEYKSLVNKILEESKVSNVPVKKTKVLPGNYGISSQMNSSMYDESNSKFAGLLSLVSVSLASSANQKNLENTRDLENEISNLKSKSAALEGIIVEQDQKIFNFEEKMVKSTNIIGESMTKCAALENNLSIIQKEYLKSKMTLETNESLHREEIKSLKVEEERLKSEILGLKQKIFDLELGEFGSKDMDKTDFKKRVIRRASFEPKGTSSEGTVEIKRSKSTLNLGNSNADVVGGTRSIVIGTPLYNRYISSLDSFDLQRSDSTLHEKYIKNQQLGLDGLGLTSAAYSAKSIEGVDSTPAISGLRKQNAELKAELDKVKESFDAERNDSKVTKNSLVEKVEMLLLEIDEIKTKSISSSDFEKFHASWDKKLNEREEMVSKYKMDTDLARVKIVEIIKLVLTSFNFKDSQEGTTKEERSGTAGNITRLYSKLMNRAAGENDYETFVEFMNKADMKLTPKTQTSSKSEYVKRDGWEPRGVRQSGRIKHERDWQWFRRPTEGSDK